MERRRGFRFTLKLLLLAVVIVVMFVYAIHRNSMIQPIDYGGNLNDVAVTVDGDELTLRDLSFYVLYEEMTVENEAIVYNKNNTRDYWNLHANGIFFKSAAKKYVMEMAVHDYLFYREGLESGIELSEDEKETLLESYSDFLDDLLLIQRDSPLYDEELIKDTMEHIAIAEKYQAYLAGRDETTYAGYGYDGYDYKNYLKNHEVKINKSVWERVSIGDNSLSHDSANAINGQEFKDE